MPQSSIMQSIISTVEGFNLHVVTAPENANTPYDACIINFGVDTKERPVAMQMIHYTQDVAASLIGVELGNNPSHLSVLTFIMTVPVEIPNEQLNDILRLIVLANKTIPLGSINYSAIEKTTYYTYSLPLFDAPPSDLTLMTVLHTAIFVKQTFFSAIDEIACKETTLEQLLQESSNKSVKTGV
jgi:hypothetical protein